MEDNQNNNRIPLYLLVVFFAIFFGTSIFLIINRKKPLSEKEINSTTAAVPAIKPAEGSLSLKLSESKETTISVEEELKIDLIADSNKKNVVGYDLVLSYDLASFEFIEATSDLADFKIYPYKKEGYLSFLATKMLQSRTPSVFSGTKIASFSFRPVKAGKYSFSLKPLIGIDRTDLVTDKTEILDPDLNELKIEVFDNK